MMIPKELKWTFYAALFNGLVGVMNLVILGNKVFTGVDYGWLNIANPILNFTVMAWLLWFVKRRTIMMIWDRLKYGTRNTSDEEGLQD